MRPGALSRGTKHKTSFVRDVVIAIIDLKDGKIEERKLDVLPPDTVFLKQTLDRGEVRRDIKEFVKSLAEVYYDKGESIVNIVESLSTDRSVNERVFEYFTKFGLVNR